MALRCSSRLGPRAAASQTPPPKSAPPSTAYAVSPTVAAPAAVMTRPLATYSRRSRLGIALTPLPCKSSQEPDGRHREQDVERREEAQPELERSGTRDS